MARAISSAASHNLCINFMSPASFVLSASYKKGRSYFKGNAQFYGGATRKFTDKKQEASASCLLLFHNMLQTHLQNGANMVVRQGIKDVFALPAEFNEMHLL